MELFDLCFGGADRDWWVELSIGGVKKAHRSYLMTGKLVLPEDLDQEAYFGPALRSAPGIMGKKACAGSQVCWVDVDSLDLPRYILPPTATIFSGHGYHLYWRLNTMAQPAEVEAVNTVLAEMTDGGDSAANIDRLLRIPGTLNLKSAPVRCEVKDMHPERVYTLQELRAMVQVEDRYRKKVLSGDRRGYKSRSERDWAIVCALLRAGFEDPWIHQVFEYNPCGDKYSVDGEDYLNVTISKARKSPKSKARKSTSKELKFVEDDHSYWYMAQNGPIQLSTFTIEPVLLLEGDVEDSVVGHVRAQGTDHVWEDIVFPKSAFAGIHALNKRLNKAAWVWLGRDSDVRHLIAHLIKQLQDLGVPRAIATNSIGRFEVDGRQYFVTNDSAMRDDGYIWESVHEAPIMFVDTGKESPEVSLLADSMSDAELAKLGKLLPKLNVPGNIWPSIGWFMATPYKPALAKLGYRFPIFNVTGTRGSGKTTLIQRVLQPLLGYKEGRGYDVNTTQFITLCLMGISNAVPIAFSEYRVSGKSETTFMRRVLLSYDSGKDARGHGDQTTTEYPLSSPFTVDGEDRLDDPAALERMIVVSLSPHDIEEGGEAWNAYRSIEGMNLNGFFRDYILHTLQVDVSGLLHRAEKDVRKAFTDTLPDRIRRNLIVTWFGALSFMEYMGDKVEHVAAEILSSCLDNVYSTTLGRAPIAADVFVEYVANMAASGTKRFPWKLENGILWFQLTPAFEAFRSAKARQFQNTLSRNSIRSQLLELIHDYMEPAKVAPIGSRKVLAYGLNLERAHQAGLDLPVGFSSNEMVIKF